MFPTVLQLSKTSFFFKFFEIKLLQDSCRSKVTFFFERKLQTDWSTKSCCTKPTKRSPALRAPGLRSIRAAKIPQQRRLLQFAVSPTVGKVPQDGGALVSPTPLAEARGSSGRCYLGRSGASCTSQVAAQWAQSELFFRLLLKNTVCQLQQAAFSNFWRAPSLREKGPNNLMENLIFLF
jgi:hypothetical protein